MNGQMETAKLLLKTHWGHDDLRPAQYDIVKAILNGRNVLGVLPTGYGKSAAFQIPALLRHGVTVVVSPLIALMKDQVDDCIKRGIKATLINSQITDVKAQSRMKHVAQGEFDLLYIAPERLRNKKFMALLASLNITMLVVDEAHCISRYGFDFRPAYQFIGHAISEGVITTAKGATPVIAALTATATNINTPEIIEGLRMGKDVLKIVADPIRPNLSYDVNHGNEWANLCRAIDEAPGKGRHIVYNSTRTAAERTCNMINDYYGFEAAAYYHAGLVTEERTKVQEAFKDGKYHVICATCAFGMGIDIPNIRQVIHFGIPHTLEDFVQESGRAGRDGDYSQALILYNGIDSYSVQMAQRAVYGNNPPYDLYRAIWVYLHTVLDDAGGILMKPAKAIARELKANKNQFREFALAEIMEHPKIQFSTFIESALNMLEAFGGVIRTPMSGGTMLTFAINKLTNTGILEFTPKQQQVMEYLRANYINPQLTTLKSKSRTNVTAGSIMIRIKQTDIQENLKVSPYTISKTIKTLCENNFAAKTREFPGKATQVINWGVDVEDVLSEQVVRKKLKDAENRLQRMIQYAESNSEAERKKIIQTYFYEGGSDD